MKWIDEGVPNYLAIIKAAYGWMVIIKTIMMIITLPKQKPERDRNMCHSLMNNLIHSLTW